MERMSESILVVRVFKESYNVRNRTENVQTLPLGEHLIQWFSDLLSHGIALPNPSVSPILIPKIE